MHDGKRNARPAGGTAGQAAEKDAASKIPQSDFNTDSSKKREEKCELISNLLHKGRNNGLTLQDLVKLTGMDERTIRRKIHVERKSGILIMADCVHGYFLPEDTYDVRRFIHSMSNRSKEIAAVSRAAEDALAKMENQEQINGW